MLAWMWAPIRQLTGADGASPWRWNRRMAASARRRLMNADFIERYLTHDAPWHQGHGAAGGFLGTGIAYYAMMYMLKARIAVCLGSGGGFVPRILRQAQRELNLEGSRTILVDANLPEAGWGSPQWLDERSFFRMQFPDVEVRLQRSSEALREYFRPSKLAIDYLHIDADHSFEGCMADFDDYLPSMAKNFVISIHDTDMPTVARVVEEVRRRDNLELINFPEIGRGLALVRPKLPSATNKLYEPYCT